MKTSKELTVQEAIGQVMMAGFDALTPNEHIKDVIKNYKVGNIILFARNIQSPKQLFTLTKSLQEFAMKELGIPLLISIDQEGGMVTRIKDEATFFPGAMTIAATNDVSNAYQVGRDMGKELHYLGVNMNLAPTMDINNNPYNPVIGVRSYSDDPKTVSAFGTAFINGLQEHVIATAKHFPGHGDTNVDSHLALPTIDITQERFESVELVPFQAAIEAGVKAIMSSHIYFPLINEDGRPTTLSKQSLTGLLRNRLGYDGLIITDSMEMKGIQHHYETPNAAVMALEAGADLICVSHDKMLQINTVYRIQEAIDHGELSTDLLYEHVDRILRYKREITPILQDYESVKHHIVDQSHHKRALQIVCDAVTLAKGTNIDPTKKTIVFAPAMERTSLVGNADNRWNLVQSILDSDLDMDAYRIPNKPSASDRLEALHKASSYEQIVYCTYNANLYVEQVTLMDAFTTMNKDTYVFSMRNPYELLVSNVVNNVIHFYEYTPNSIVAVIRYLEGNLIPSGRTPIHYE
jgi:beta-N-acetylhexosaminidase